MQSTQNVEEFTRVREQERGDALRRRRLAHGIRSVREFSDASGVSRNAVTAAEEGRGSEGTYQRLEAWLDAFDHETGADVPAVESSAEQMEIVVEGDLGVRVTVKGPISDREALVDSVAKIMRSIRESSPDTPGS
jgi:transcriptional regulator with XRE-family HTH domain